MASSVMSSVFGGGSVKDVELKSELLDLLDGTVMTIADCKAVGKRLAKGEITVEELRILWTWYLRDREFIKAELSSLKKDELLRYAGMFSRKSEKKDRLISSALDSMSGNFYHWSMSWAPFSETREHALDRKINGLTDEFIQDCAAERRGKEAQDLKALTNPETLSEFDLFISYRGAKALELDQIAVYDRLRAEAGRDRRSWQTEQEAARSLAEKSTAKAVDLDESIALSWQKTVHTRDGYDLWVVQMSDRVERDKYMELKARAKVLGGWYSSFRGNGAIPGFQFKDEESAVKFCAVDEVVKSEAAELAELPESDRKQRAINHLLEVAGSMIAESREAIQRDRLVNTHRRLRIADGCIQDAIARQNLAQTIRRVVKALQTSEAVFCDRLYYRTEFEDLDRYLSYAKYAAMRANKEKFGEHTRSVQDADIMFAEYPYPSFYSNNLESLIDAAKLVPGIKLAAARLDKLMHFCKPKGWDKDPEKKHESWMVRIPSHRVDDLRLIIDRIKSSRSSALVKVKQRYSFESAIEMLLRYDRLQRLNIPDLVTLRTALREYLAFKNDRVRIPADPMLAIRRQEKLAPLLRIQDFFPTPKSLRDRSYELAEITPGMRVLEPGAGRGDYADEMRDMGCGVSVCEVNHYLLEILEAKDHKVVATDFLEFQPIEKFDRIIGNLPFTDNEDIKHCYQAYNCLKLDGRAVLIVGAGSIENGRAEDEDSIPQDKLNKFQAFRRWLDEIGAGLEKLPDGSFLESDRKTSAGAYYVIFDR